MTGELPVVPACTCAAQRAATVKGTVKSILGTQPLSAVSTSSLFPEALVGLKRCCTEVRNLVLQMAP